MHDLHSRNAPESCIPEGVSQNDVYQHLAELLNHDIFNQSTRHQQFLSYLLKKVLDGGAENLKGYTIGVEAFNKPIDFDPTLDSSVRVEAGRLRAKLAKYYATSESENSICFRLPKGGYTLYIDVVENGDNSAPTLKLSSNPEESPKPVLAVLPFTNFGNDPEQEYFADGITDDLISALSRLTNLRVIARHSSFRFKGVAGDPAEIAATLHAQYLVEGSVRRSSDKLRTNVQLIDASTGTELWGERFDRQIGEVFAVQDEITRSIVQALELRFTVSGQAVSGYIGTRNVKAYEALLKGMHLHHGCTRVSLSKAIEAYSDALAFDPKYTNAHIWRSRAHAHIGMNKWEPDPSMSFVAALADGEAAARLSPDSAFANVAVAWANLWLKNSERAKEALDLAYKQGGTENEADSLRMMGMAYAALGDKERSLTLCTRALRLNPIRSASYYFAIALCHFLREEWDDLIVWCKQGIATNQKFFPNYWLLLACYGVTEEFTEAGLILNQFRELAPNVAFDEPSFFFVQHEAQMNLKLGWTLIESNFCD